jgi:long-chain acyl-CoA synthetase
MVTGQDERQVCALVVPSYEALAERFGRPFGPADAEGAEVRAALKDEIARVLPDGATKPYERVRRFHVLREEWKPGEELTATLKLKRDVIRAKYAAAIAAAR